MKIIVQNLAIEYEDKGTGKVVLFLHGWQDNLYTFDSFADVFASTYRVIRLDLPGFGKSEIPKEAWNLDDYVHFVKNFIQKLNIHADVLVGHSFGGRIAIKGTATKNFHPHKIILIGSAGIAKNRTFRNSVLKIFAKAGGWILSIPPLIFWREGLRKKIYKYIGSDYGNAGALKETFVKIISEDLTMSAKKITTPALLIWGVKDTETPLSDGELLSRLIQNSRLKVVDGAGHYVHREKPEEVVKLIQEFL